MNRYLANRLDWRRAAPCIGLLAALTVLPACTGRTTTPGGTEADLAASARLTMPVRIKIEPWTQPVSLSGKGKPDGVEVLLAAYDAFGDEIKIVGTIHFELFTWRPANANHRDLRVAFWPIELRTHEAMAECWDRSVRFHRFTLRLPDVPFKAGRYILAATLLTPAGERLFDEYEMTVESGTTASPSRASSGRSPS